MKRTIRLKILIGFALLLSLSTLVQGVSFLITKEYVSSQITSFQQEQVKKGANEVENFFTELSKNSYGLAQTYQKDKKSVDASSLYVIHNSGYIKKITFLSPMGKELQKYDVQGKIPDDKLTYEVLSDPFFSAKSGTSAISKVYYLEASLGPHLDLYSPIFGDDRKVNGVIKLQINLNQLNTIVKDSRLGENGYLYVVDDEGRLLAHPTERYVLDRPNLSSRQIITDYQKNTTVQPHYEYVNEKNVQVLAKAYKISGYNWIVVFEQPVSEAYGFLDLIFNFFVATLAGSLILLLVIAFLLSENLTKSIRKLEISAKQVHQGKMKRITIINSGDEIESLSHSLSALVDKLLERERSLQKLMVELGSANSKLKELDVLKNEFVSVASHELRTPMTAIKSYLWMALQGKGGELTEKQKYYIQRGYNSADRLIRLVNDMLNISRIESGSTKIVLQEVDLKKLTQDVVDEMQPKAKEGDVCILMPESGQIPAVLADYDKVKEIYFNLLGNALKFTPKGGTITISMQMKDGYVETRIKDSGNGIEAEDIGKLFQKFGLMPGSYVTNQIASGTGLGLYICKTIIEQHQGKIWADSEGKGKGATFSFILKVFTNEALQEFKENHIPDKT